MEMVLGGLKFDGSYGENAYARFVYDFLGLKLEDPRRYTLARLWKNARRKNGRRGGTPAVQLCEIYPLLKQADEVHLGQARGVGLESPQAAKVMHGVEQSPRCVCAPSAPNVSYFTTRTGEEWRVAGGKYGDGWIMDYRQGCRSRRQGHKRHIQ